MSVSSVIIWWLKQTMEKPDFCALVLVITDIKQVHSAHQWFQKVREVALLSNNWWRISIHCRFGNIRLERILEVFFWLIWYKIYTVIKFHHEFRINDKVQLSSRVDSFVSNVNCNNNGLLKLGVSLESIKLSTVSKSVRESFNP